jgi:glycosyltransferase involved in cell wall biosynthesis
LIEDGESGFLVHPKDHTLYAERILEILNNDSRCIEIGEAAIKRVRIKFDIRETVRQNIDFYKSLIGK